MENKKTFFDYAGQALMIFGLMVAFLSVSSYFAGEEGKDTSTLFRLGAEGMSMASLAQLFGLAAVTTALRGIILSDRIFKNLSATVKTFGMVISCIAATVVFILVFDWFPAGQILPWLLFAVSFGVCFAVSFVLTISKQKRENKEMAQALARLKNEL